MSNIKCNNISPQYPFIVDVD